MENHKFIFIGGLHRSGKSLICKCLGEHPLISGFSKDAVYQDEGQHAQSVYKPANFYGGPGKFAFNPEAHITESSPLISEANRIKLFSEWKRYWDIEKPYLMEQSPPNLIRTRFLQEMFPDSYFIIVTRHPVPVAYETQRCMGDNKATIYSLIRHWLISHETFEGDRARIRRLFVLKYEDFVKDPDQYLENIYAFLGLDNHPTAQEIRSDINSSYFEKWNNYKGNLILKCYVNFLRKRFEARVNRFGYSLYDLDSTASE